MWPPWWTAKSCSSFYNMRANITHVSNHRTWFIRVRINEEGCGYMAPQCVATSPKHGRSYVRKSLVDKCFVTYPSEHPWNHDAKIESLPDNIRDESITRWNFEGWSQYFELRKVTFFYSDRPSKVTIVDILCVIHALVVFATCNEHYGSCVVTPSTFYCHMLIMR